MHTASRNKKGACLTMAREGGPHRTRPQLAVQMLRLVAERHPPRRFHVLGDGSYSGQSVVKHLPANFDLTGRIHPRAVLYAPPPAPSSGTRGRRRKRGPRVPSPTEIIEHGPAGGDRPCHRWRRAPR
jgi:hypothetical protein